MNLGDVSETKDQGHSVSNMARSPLLNSVHYFSSSILLTCRNASALHCLQYCICMCMFWRQTNEIVNTAVLTGVVQSYPMTVYSVSHAGHVADVTSQATCHAGDADILQVTTTISLFIHLLSWLFTVSNLFVVYSLVSVIIIIIITMTISMAPKHGHTTDSRAQYTRFIWRIVKLSNGCIRRSRTDSNNFNERHFKRNVLCSSRMYCYHPNFNIYFWCGHMLRNDVNDWDEKMYGLWSEDIKPGSRPRITRNEVR